MYLGQHRREDSAFAVFNALIYIIAEPPVTITHHLVGTSVLEGEVARLECELSRETREAATWLKGKERIHAGGRYEIISEGKKQALLIHAFKPEDQGLYTCVASPDVKSSASLSLEGTSNLCLMTYIHAIDGHLGALL